MNLENIKNIHFVGIGGIGMSGIAEILAERGVKVSGCDLKPSATDLLAGRGIHVLMGHDAARISRASNSSSSRRPFTAQNLEVDSAARDAFPVMKRRKRSARSSTRSAPSAFRARTARRPRPR